MIQLLSPSSSSSFFAIRRRCWDHITSLELLLNLRLQNQKRKLFRFFRHVIQIMQIQLSKLRCFVLDRSFCFQFGCFVFASFCFCVVPTTFVIFVYVVSWVSFFWALYHFMGFRLHYGLEFCFMGFGLQYCIFVFNSSISSLYSNFVFYSIEKLLKFV